MRASDVDVLIAGGGLAAQRTCETLRRLGYDGRVRLLCDERHAPYDRPPLSKAVLTGERGSETPSLRPAGWYREHDVELMLGARASALDPAARRVDLEDGACATGSWWLRPAAGRGACRRSRSATRCASCERSMTHARCASCCRAASNAWRSWGPG